MKRREKAPPSFKTRLSRGIKEIRDWIGLQSFETIGGKEKRLTFLWGRWCRRLSRKRVIGLVNLNVFLLLFWQMSSIIGMGGDFNLEAALFNSMSERELPYPLNIVAQVHHNNISVAPWKGPHQHAGYGNIRAGTFRSKYPSNSLPSRGTFDEVYVISNLRCAQQLSKFEKKCRKAGLPVQQWPQTDPHHFSLNDPPIPISQQLIGEIKQGSNESIPMLKRQIAYLDTHRRVWQHAILLGKQRIFVIDDTLFPTAKLLESFPFFLSNVDQESVAHQKPWHFIFLRRMLLASKLWKEQGVRREATWAMNSKYHHAVVQANVSYGVGAYVLSLEGARFLHGHITEYRRPLDVEIGMLQIEFSKRFVALSACNNDEPSPFCPEMMDDISERLENSIDCVWRRIEEQRTAQNFHKYIPAV